MAERLGTGPVSRKKQRGCHFMRPWSLTVDDFEGPSIIYDRAKVSRRIRRAGLRLGLLARDE